MKPILVAFLLIILVSRASAQYLSNGLGSALVGGYGSIVIHESGHALTAKLLGKEIHGFRPYPSRVQWRMPDGSLEKKWTLGMVRVKSEPGEKIWQENNDHALYAAMGSGANAVAVLLLAPLLPQVSGFGAQSLDDMLLFSTFDLPSYVLVDALGFTGRTGDWSQVAEATHVPIYWWLLGALTESLLLNQYRLHWRNRAPEAGIIRNTSAVAAAIKFSF